MFKEIIQSINGEIEWIDFELSRQSTSPDQGKKLLERKKQLKHILVLASDYDERFK